MNPDPPFGKPFKYTDAYDMKVLKKSKTLGLPWWRRIFPARRPQAWRVVNPPRHPVTKIMRVVKADADILAAENYERTHPNSNL